MRKDKIEKGGIMKRRIVSLIMILTIPFVVASCDGNNDTGKDSTTVTPSASKYIPGNYEARAAGYGGDIMVTVELSENKIEAITAAGPDETQDIGTKAIDSLPTEMVDKQTAQVDVVTGATVTSNGIIDAASTAILDGTVK